MCIIECLHIYIYILFYIDVVRVVDSTVVEYRSGALHRFVGRFLVSRPSNQLLSWEVGGGPPGRPSTFDFWGANLLLSLEKENSFTSSHMELDYYYEVLLLLFPVTKSLGCVALATSNAHYGIMALLHYCSTLFGTKYVWSQLCGQWALLRSK